MIAWAALAGVLLAGSLVAVLLLARTLRAVRELHVEVVQLAELRAETARLRTDGETWRATARGLRRRSGPTPR